MGVHLTITDFRRLHCVWGAKKAFDAAGLDFKDFLENGAQSDDLMGHGYDAVVERVVETKMRAEHGQQ